MKVYYTPRPNRERRKKEDD
ncbi:Uncharacterized protein APZ42_021352 [Daphnia magna]|uniref:Uncharacterized protein n=1 Tax=Daphnia magna TaxID=35525 RepID=A0A164WRE7_9CRUS|nr:Uncharacterized protein APZ42_021352 [Daphnia magna]